MKKGALSVALDITNQTKFRVGKAAMRRVVERTLVLCGKKRGAFEMSIVLVSEPAMRALNAAWRGKDKPTDVLSFSFLETNKTSRFPASEKVYLGEVFICPFYAKKQARELNISFLENMLTLASHGTIHICGIDHERSQREYEKTMTIQQEVISRKFIKL